MSEMIFEVRVPTNFLDYGFNQNKVQRHITEWIVFSLFTEGRVSSGKAAQFLGLTRIEFLTLLRKHSIAYIDYSSEELGDEFEAVKTLQMNLTQ